MSAPREPSSKPLDWESVRASIRRRMAYHLQGWPAEEIEDAAQDVAFKLLRFIDRSGSPMNLEGLLTVIARRTAVERFRSRSRRPAHQPIEDASAVTLDDAARHELAQLEERVARRAFHVLEYFRANHAPCLELAEARARGLDFKRLAVETRQSHVALLQRWSRCMKRLRSAIAGGEIPWDRSEEES